MAKAVSAQVYENDLAPVITTSAENCLVAHESVLGSEMFWETPRDINGQPFALVNPNYQVTSPTEGHTLTFEFTVKNGYFFNPTSVEFLSSAIGTNAGYYDLAYTWGNMEYTIQTEVHPNRNNESEGFYSTVNEAISAVPRSGKFTLTFQIHHLAQNKQMAFSNVTVKGVLQKNPNGDDDDTQYGTARTIDVKTPGTFAQEFLNTNFNEWIGIDSLTVNGSLNETDLNNIKKVTPLRYLDLSGATFTTVPNSFFWGHAYIETVILPDATTTIDNRAFGNCQKLNKVTAANIININDEAFYYCSELTAINLSYAENIGYQVFKNCRKLGDIDLSHVTAVGGGSISELRVFEYHFPDGFPNSNGNACLRRHRNKRCVNQGIDQYP